MFPQIRNFYGFPISRKSEARDEPTDRRTDGCATLNAASQGGSLNNKHSTTIYALQISIEVPNYYHI